MVSRRPSAGVSARRSNEQSLEFGGPRAVRSQCGAPDRGIAFVRDEQRTPRGRVRAGQGPDLLVEEGQSGFQDRIGKRGHFTVHGEPRSVLEEQLPCLFHLNGGSYLSNGGPGCGGELSTHPFLPGFNWGTESPFKKSLLPQSRSAYLDLGESTVPTWDRPVRLGRGSAGAGSLAHHVPGLGTRRDRGERLLEVVQVGTGSPPGSGDRPFGRAPPHRGTRESRA